MGTILASALITQAQTILEDTTGVRWGTQELLDWLNAAQREVVNLRPSANVVTTVVSLVAGTKQTLPADGIQLLDVIRNMGADSATPGLPVRQTTRQMLDLQQPTWHSDTSLADIEHYVYDSQVPKVFWVYPKSDATQHIEIQYSANPTTIGSSNSVITLDDVYAGPLLDLTLYRAYSKDTEHDGNEQRAQLHRAAAEHSLGLKAAADGATATVNSPEKK